MDNDGFACSLFKKHQEQIVILDLDERSFRKKISNEKGYEIYNSTSKHDTVFYWDKINPKFSFFFDYENNEKEVCDFFVPK